MSGQGIPNVTQAATTTGSEEEAKGSSKAATQGAEQLGGGQSQIDVGKYIFFDFENGW